MSPSAPPPRSERMLAKLAALALVISAAAATGWRDLDGRGSGGPGAWAGARAWGAVSHGRRIGDFFAKSFDPAPGRDAWFVRARSERAPRRARARACAASTPPPPRPGVQTRRAQRRALARGARVDGARLYGVLAQDAVR